jgi:hypothetical protein
MLQPISGSLLPVIHLLNGPSVHPSLCHMCVYDYVHVAEVKLRLLTAANNGPIHPPGDK